MQWQGATQTHFPPRPRKSAWRLRHHGRNFATRSAHTVQASISRDTANHPAHQRRAAFTPACFALPVPIVPARSPATRRVYTSMFRAPQWHGATQTHFPPRPRKSAWRCDITNVISPHGLPTHYKQSSYHTIPPIIPLTSDTPRLHQHVSRSPVARRHANALFTTKAAQIRMALRHHERNFATRSVCPHTRSNPIARYCQSSCSPATRRVYTSMFRAPQWHGATQTHFHQGTKSAWHCDIANVIRHTVCPHARSNQITRTANHPASSRNAVYTQRVCSYKLATSESSSEKALSRLHLHYKLAMALRPKSSFPALHFVLQTGHF